MATTPKARFTLRCLSELGVTPPKLPDCIDDIDHPLLRAAQLAWSADKHPTERIASIDDTVLIKCKPNVPWRAAVWEERVDGGLPWLVAAGPRQEGGRDDFYAALARTCTAARKQHNAAGQHLEPGKKTYSKHLLPTDDDRLRLLLERAQHGLRDARASVNALVDQARHAPGTAISGHALGADLEAFAYRTDLDELYLFIKVAASVPPDVYQVILALAVPGLQAEDWQPLQAGPNRPVGPNEIVWLTLLEVPRLHR